MTQLKLGLSVQRVMGLSNKDHTRVLDIVDLPTRI